MGKVAMRNSLIIAVALFTASCGSSTKTTSSAGGASSCTKVSPARPQPGREHLTAPTQKLPAGSVWNMQFKTNCGDFTIQVDSGQSPKTAASIVSLAKSGFYDGLSFHRLAPGFVIQGGDPAGTGLGDPGYKTVEPPPSSQQYPRGAVAMAKGGADAPGTAGSQFFIVTGDTAQFEPEYAVLGKVTSGLSTADLISAQPIDQSRAMGGPQDGPPLDPIVIQSVKVTRQS